MSKVECRYHTIDEKVIQDGLSAVGALEDSPHSKESCFVVGGIATQSYLPSTCRRSTTDIDLAVTVPLGYAEFKSFASNCLNYLRDNGYTIRVKKGRNSFEILYGDEEKGEALIEFSRKTQKNFASALERLDLEFGRARKKLVEGGSETYRVACPEDIITPKLVRSVNSLRREVDYLDAVVAGGDFSLTPNGIGKRLGFIKSLKNDAIRHIGDPRASERLRLVSDLYDMRVLSALVGINEHDFREAIKPWNSLHEGSEQLQLIVKHVLPEMNVLGIVSQGF